MAVTRRHVLIGGAAAAGLVVAWQFMPREYPNPLPVAEGERGFGAYLKIAKDGSVTVAVPQCEMGQGITTVIPQIVAQELGADWRSVAVEAAPVSPVYANHVLAREWAQMLWPAGLDDIFADDNVIAARYGDDARFMLTAGSAALANYESPAREAGAAARALLCQAAAARWDVAWEACQTQDGFVVHEDKRLRFAELVDEAKTFDVPDPIPVRGGIVSTPAPINESAQIPYPRLDLPGKVDGSVTFAGDIRLPDMVYASLRQGPIGNSRLKALDRGSADSVTGLIEIVKHERWVAAVASNWWAANQALGKMNATFETRGNLAEDSLIESGLNSAFDSGAGKRLHAVGDIGPAFAGGTSHSAQYDVAAMPHATIETSTATARYADGQLELWLATQSPEMARRAAAGALGLNADDVVLYPVMAGGSFDRRLENEVAVQAALLARHMQRPVQLVWSRGEEMIHDPVRTPVRAKLAAVTDEAGRVTAMSVKIAAPASAREFAQRLFAFSKPHDAMREVSGKYDYMAVQGTLAPYAIAHMAVDHYPADISVPTGRSRANADGYSCFFIESFIDELARKAGSEPLSYRMQMLGGETRLARCLSNAAVLGGWNGGLDNSGQGIACHKMNAAGRSAHIAIVANARQGDGGIEVERLSAVVDIGRIINRDITRQQIEGGMIFGLASAMGCATGYQGGLTTARRLRDMKLPVLGNMPEIEIELVESNEDPVDPGEIGVPAVAPAIANALFSASGLRTRTLPLLANGL